MIHSKKKVEGLQTERIKKKQKKKRVKAQSANVCQRHSVKRKERKHKVLVKKIEKKSDM